MTKIRSRIHEYFTPQLMKDLYTVCTNSVVSDNNIKASAMIDILRNHRLDFIELGPGTNRLAILIEGYVFKIAMDKWGLQDNLNEFTTSQELQPYVVKTYETNELIAACEYVTVISREEFQENREKIRDILSILAESYLLGDVGTVNKNFTNWGYRDNGDLVILDFAYIYRVQGDELLCSMDQSILEYDENFHKLYCPMCKKQYTFMDLRRRIPMEQEKHENMIAKKFAYKLIEPVQEFKEGYRDDESDEESSLYNTNETTIDSREETSMKFNEKDIIDEEEQEDSYLATLELMKSLKGAHLEEAHPTEAPELDDEEIDEQQEVLKEILQASNKPKEEEKEEVPVLTNTIEIERESETEKSSIRIVTQTPVTMVDEDHVWAHGTIDGNPITIDLGGVDDAEPLQEVLLDAAIQVEEAIEQAQEVMAEVEPEDFGDIEAAPLLEDDDQMSDEDVELYNIIEEAEANEPDANSPLVVGDMRIATGDFDNDGLNEVYIDPEPQSFMAPTMINISLGDDESDDEETDEEELALRAIMDADQGNQLFEEEEEVEFTNTVRLTDTISVETAVKVKMPESEADKLRRELMGQIEDEDIDTKKVEKLAEDYSHLQEEADEYNFGRKGNGKDWK